MPSFFASIERAKKKFGFNFPNKEKILELLVKQEDFRDKVEADLKANPAINKTYEIGEVVYYWLLSVLYEG